MDLGGPVWHASAAARPDLIPVVSLLRRYTLTALEGVGDEQLGEWDEWTGKAYHIRRRLSPPEELVTGGVVDVRGTPEATQRLLAVRPWLPIGWSE